MRPLVTLSRIASAAGLAALLTAALAVAPMAWPAQALALDLGGLFGSPVDAKLVAQVPKDRREGIVKAEFALACARQDQELAELKEELADRQDDLANLHVKLAKCQTRGAEIALDIAKMEAVLASSLGTPGDNRKVLDGLKTDRAKNDLACKELQTKTGPATLMVRDWTSRVAAKEKAVAEFKARRPSVSGVAAPALAPAPAPAAPVEDPLEIVRPQPGAEASPAPAAPAAPASEADLKN